MQATLLLIASLEVLGIWAQNPPRSPPILGCTTSSFAMPSWLVQNISAAESVSFSLLNRATNYSTVIQCPESGDGWNACAAQEKGVFRNDTTLVAIKKTGATAEVAVNQSWVCSDRDASRPLKFSAVGTAHLPLNFTRVATTGNATVPSQSLPFLVRGTLLAPIAITPAYAQGPPGHDTPGCAAAAQSPSWTLSTISYVSRVGDGVTAVSSQSFLLQLINPVIGYQASCMAGYLPVGQAASSQAAVGKVIHVACTGNEFGALGSDRYRIASEGTFNTQSFEFTVNQTWYCDDVNPGSPSKVTATGSTVLPLECTSELGPNTTSCGTRSSVPVKGHLVQEEALPPYSIEDPVPTPDGCTLSSILHPRWTFSAFAVDSSNTTDNSSLSFNVILQTNNPGFQFPISITQGEPVAGSPSWYACSIGEGGDDGPTLWPHACSFQYTPAQKKLLLKADWYCNDLDEKHPITFSGFTATTMESPLSCEASSDGVSHCVTKDTAYTWGSNITNVTWSTA